jgi:hypothetical protein
MKTKSRQPAASEHGEFLILPDGKILAHNITPVLAKVLSELNPADAAMKRRANQKNNLKHELPN